MEEASVLALVRAGNADAFSDVVDRYQAPVQRYIYRLTGDYELARDLTQNTFIQAYKSIMKTDSPLSFKAWLYRIATNNVWQNHRKKKLLPLLRFDDHAETDKSTGDIQSSSSDEKMAIQAVLVKIPPEQRTCLVLHLVEGFKYREIAQTIGISEDAVRMRVGRGKEAFQRLYKGGTDR